MKKIKQLKKTINYLLIVAVLAAGTSSCAKLWEDMYIEIHTCPEVDVEPEMPDWESNETTTINE